MHKSVYVATVGLGALLAGCAVGPRYQPPAPPSLPAFGAPATNLLLAATPEVRWWTLFNDPILNGLVQHAAANNQDLKIAWARLNESRALRRRALWEFAPQGSAATQFERRQLSARELAGSGIPASIGNTWSAGFDASWEIDLFGRLRYSAIAASAQAGVAQAELRNTQVALLAEVAANYFSLRGAQQSKVLLAQQRALLERSLETTQKRANAGRGTQLDISRAEAFLKETDALLPLAEQETQQHLHRLAVLLGENPTTFTIVPQAQTGNFTPKEIRIGGPGDLLRRRPDIVAAERNLAAASAVVGVRTAEMFPEVSISGFIRFIGGEGTSLGSAASQAWSVAPNATWHLLSLGRLNANRRSSQSRADGALAAYEQSILRALEDVENALLRYGTAEQRLRSLGDRQSAAERALRIAQAQYAAGAISALEKIDAERTALAAARETVAAATEHRLAVVAINKALGGGWEDRQTFASR